MLPAPMTFVLPYATSRPSWVLKPASATRLLLAALLAGMPSGARAQSPDTTMWITNAPVSAIATVGNITYLGGEFTFVGANTGGGAPLSTATGVPVAPFPRIGGFVFAAVADGSGGWFIGGQFSMVGAFARSNLAHVLSDGSVSSWTVNTSGQVNALALQGGTLYVGGQVSFVGGQSRSNLAAVDAATGVVTGWNPSANMSVNALAVSATRVYAGGQFNTIGTTQRRCLAAIDVTSGLPVSWNPVTIGPTPNVSAIALSGTTVYAGGAFSNIGGQARSFIAAIDSVTGHATPWNPGSNSSVTALAVSGTTIYAGGFFSTMGGLPRVCLAAIEAGTGVVTSWNPTAAGGTLPYVTALAVDGPTVYAGGGFSVVGGQPRANLAALDAATGLATPWDPGASGQVDVLALGGPNIYVGGGFNSVGGRPRHYIAAIDASTGTTTSWDPAANGFVNALAVSGSVVFAGGLFDSIGGQARSRVAALDPSTGLATAWSPDAAFTGTPGVNCFALSGSTLYAGGAFSATGSITRNNLVALDATSGALSSWDAAINAQVRTLLLSGNTLYAGGVFTTVGGLPRDNIAAVDATTGAATPWAPDANGFVSALALGGNSVYAAGDFTSIGGQPRNYLAALDTATGLATAWDPGASGSTTSLDALTLGGNTLYVGGRFTTLGGQPRANLGALDVATGIPTSWNPGANFTVRALVVGAGRIQVGGGFSVIGGSSRPYLASLSAPDLLDVGRSFAVRGLRLTSAPNPARNSASIRFTLPAAGPVRLALFDVAGRLVMEPLSDAQLLAGPHQITVQTGSLPAGLYFARLEQQGRSVSHRLLKLR